MITNCGEQNGLFAYWIVSSKTTTLGVKVRKEVVFIGVVFLYGLGYRGLCVRAIAMSWEPVEIECIANDENCYVVHRRAKKCDTYHILQQSEPLSNK
jgi:hypothetical protein